MAPEAFNAVYMKIVSDIFTSVMIYDAVPVGAIFGKRVIGGALVCADRAAALNIGKDQGRQRCPVGVWHWPRPQRALALQHSEHDRLAARGVTAANAIPLTADIGLVDFDVAGEWSVLVGICHVLAYLVRHAPRSFVSAADLTLQFLGCHPVPSCRHKIHRKEPVGERCARLLKWRADTRVDVMAAILAGIRAALRDTMIGGLDAARGAGDTGAAVLNLHDLVQARRIGRVLGLKLFEGVLAHRGYPTCDLGIA